MKPCDTCGRTKTIKGYRTTCEACRKKALRQKALTPPPSSVAPIVPPQIIGELKTNGRKTCKGGNLCPVGKTTCLVKGCRCH